MKEDKVEVLLGSSADGLGIVLTITNRTQIPVTVFEPHPHTSVWLHDADGRPFPWHFGVFAASPRWHVTVPPGGTSERIVLLPRFFLDARGDFEVICDVSLQAGDQDVRLTVRGKVRLSLPTSDEFYSDAGADVRLRLERYERSGFVYPLPDGP